MMDDTRLDDAALDVLVSESVRVEAPEGFAIRVAAALDSRESSARPRAWLRPSFAVAALLLLAALWWWRQPVPVNPEGLRETRAVAPVAPHAPRAPHTPHAPIAPVAHVAPVAPVAPVADHERALDALADVPAVQQEAIDPAAIRARTIDVRPAEAITPLTVDTDRPDPGGEGDHR